MVVRLNTVVLPGCPFSESRMSRCWGAPVSVRTRCASMRRFLDLAYQKFISWSCVVFSLGCIGANGAHASLAGKPLVRLTAALARGIANKQTKRFAQRTRWSGDACAKVRLELLTVDKQFVFHPGHFVKENQDD